jgi:ABC-2 type transport system ATP-binding protein
VELRRSMWEVVRSLREHGVTIILTTHYLEEAEQMADRIGVINAGEIVLVEQKHELMTKLGEKRLTLQLEDAVEQIPDALAAHALELGNDGYALVYTYNANDKRTGINSLFRDLDSAGLRLRDVDTKQSSLEEIFVDLVKAPTTESTRNDA